MHVALIGLQGPNHPHAVSHSAFVSQKIRVLHTAPTVLATARMPPVPLGSCRPAHAPYAAAHFLQTSWVGFFPSGVRHRMQSHEVGVFAKHSCSHA